MVKYYIAGNYGAIIYDPEELMPEALNNAGL
jgi:hypothetical protein